MIQSVYFCDKLAEIIRGDLPLVGSPFLRSLSVKTEIDEAAAPCACVRVSVSSVEEIIPGNMTLEMQGVVELLLGVHDGTAEGLRGLIEQFNELLEHTLSPDLWLHRELEDEGPLVLHFEATPEPLDVSNNMYEARMGFKVFVQF